MVDRVKTYRPDGREGTEIPVTRLHLLTAPVIEPISATALTLSDAYHQKILDFTSGSAVTVTVPEGLRSDFVCGISQGGAGQVTLVEASSLVEIDEASSQFATEAQYVLLTLMAFAANTFRLYGRTA